MTWSVNATAYGIDPHATWEVVPAALSGGAWRVVGHGDERSMVVESLRVDNPHGALIATGGFAWKPGFTWHADATTRGMIGAAELAALPRGAILIHTARGGIVDEAALLAALDAGQLAAAGVDVFAKEPLEAENPLRAHPRVLPTPHLAANTPRGAVGMATGAAESIVAVLAGRLPALEGAIVVPGSLRAAA